MALKTITSANATLFVTVDGLWSSPQQLEGFGTDSAVEQDDFTPGVAEKGVDGKMSVGWVPTVKVIKISFAADSPSLSLMADWIEAQEKAREVMPCNMTFNLRSIGKSYTGTKGVITGGGNMPNAQQTLKPRQYTLTFESWESQDI